MKLTNIFTAGLTVMATATAAAIESRFSSPVDVVIAPLDHIYRLSLIVCTDPKFLGKCATFKGRDGGCANFEPSWQNQISAVDTKVEPIGVVQSCSLYSELGCGGKSESFTQTRVDDLAVSRMDNVAKSYMCEEVWFEPPSGER